MLRLGGEWQNPTGGRETPGGGPLAGGLADPMSKRESLEEKGRRLALKPEPLIE